MDPVSDVIALLRPHAVFSKPITGRGRWGVSYPAYGLPGFSIVLAGRCWLAIEEDEPLLLERSDFVLLPASPAFSMVSDPGAACVPGDPTASAVRHGDPRGEPDFSMLGGTFRLDPVNAPLLLSLLPRLIVIRSGGGASGRLAGLIGLIIDECAGERPGRKMVLARLLEVLLMECLRWPGSGGDALPPGLLAGMRDPALAAALRALHADVSAAWTVAGLARHAGMSRSVFAAHFSATVGCAPMEYLSRWRMTLAKVALARGGTPLERLAEQIGYQSASAFSTAFRREVGCAPGAFARLRQGGEAVAS